MIPSAARSPEREEGLRPGRPSFMIIFRYTPMTLKR